MEKRFSIVFSKFKATITFNKYEIYKIYAKYVYKTLTLFAKYDKNITNTF